MDEKNRIVIALAGLVILFLGAGILIYYKNVRQIDRIAVSSPSPAPAETPQASPPTETPEKEANIKVYRPTSLMQVSLPFVVTGEARVFENTVNLRLRDTRTDEIIYESFTTATSPDVGLFGPFEKEISHLYKKPVSDEVTLEVLWYSPKDGAELDLVNVPLRLDTTDTTTLEVFFNNSRMDPEFSCNKVFPVERITVRTQTPARHSLELLLEGPSRTERENGFSTSINPGVKIQKLTIENGVAKADFDETLEFQVGGSCRVAAIRAQITETLKKFPTVNEVIISINGRTEDILQP